MFSLGHILRYLGRVDWKPSYAKRPSVREKYTWGSRKLLTELGLSLPLSMLIGE